MNIFFSFLVQTSMYVVFFNVEFIVVSCVITFLLKEFKSIKIE